jgi:hypothetical protein
MPVRKKSNTNFVAEEPKQGWAYFEDMNQWRRTPYPWGAPGDHFPKEYGDWVAVKRPKSWQPPQGTLAGESLLSGGAGLLRFAPEGGADDAGLPAGGHTKIGAGHKPQPYDEHGRYTGPNTGPRGGSIPMDGGPVRLFANDADEEPGGGEPGGEASPDEEAGAGPEEKPEAEQEVYQELQGVLVADNGRVGTDTPGGLSGGYEVRGPVTPRQAEVTWKNDEPDKPDPKPDDVKQQMRETVENLQKDNPQLDSINVNSGKRDGDPKKDPHADGRAVDINKVNDIPVKDLADPKTPEAERACQAARNMEEQAKKDPNVNQVIGPDGGWNKDAKGKITPMDPVEHKALLDQHKDHYHINVFRK